MGSISDFFQRFYQKLTKSLAIFGFLKKLISKNRKAILNSKTLLDSNEKFFPILGTIRRRNDQFYSNFIPKVTIKCLKNVSFDKKIKS